MRVPLSTRAACGVPQLELRHHVHPMVPVTIGCELVVGTVLGLAGYRAALLLIGVTAVIAVTAFALARWDEMFLTAVLAISILLDWYGLVTLPVHIPLIAVSASTIYLARAFIGASAVRPWISPPRALLLLWVALVAIGAVQATRGIYVGESVLYWLTVLVALAIMYTAGVQACRNVTRLYTFLRNFSAFGTLVALHTIIYARTGIFVLSTSSLNAYVSSHGNFPLQWASASVVRAGSFLFNPDWDGAFLGMMACILIGLVVAAPTKWAKAAFTLEAMVVLLGLLFTYSGASFIAVTVAMVVFVTLIGTVSQRLQFLAAIGVLGIGAFLAFPEAFQHLIEHATASNASQLRQAAWATALRVIHAYPWTGTGLGAHTYAQAASRFDVPLLVAQQRTLDPLNSYLELAAEAGVPILGLYVAVVGVALSAAMRTYLLLDRRSRALVAGAIAAVIEIAINGLAIPTWTLPPLAVAVWLILGAASSPALAAPIRSRARARPAAQIDSHATIVKNQTMPIGGAMHSA